MRKLNEDALLQATASGLWAVADGMGGHDAGDYASAVLTSALGGAAGADLDDLIGDVRERLSRTNGELIEEGRRRRARIVGSTVVVMLARGDRAAVLWAGDSRLYRFDGRRLELLTTDHSRVQELVASGKLAPEDAEAHPEANIITRAVGVSEILELESRSVSVRDGDTFLLCSDGLSRYVSEQTIASALADPSCQQVCDRLMDAALASPARDNISLVVVRAREDDSALRTRINAEPMGDDPTEPEHADTVLDRKP